MSNSSNNSLIKSGKKSPPSLADKNIALMKQNNSLQDKLAETKLKLVESQCRVQELEHMLIAREKELKLANRSWMSKFKDELIDKN